MSAPDGVAIAALLTAVGARPEEMAPVEALLRRQATSDGPAAMWREIAEAALAAHRYPTPAEAAAARAWSSPEAFVPARFPRIGAEQVLDAARSLRFVHTLPGGAALVCTLCAEGTKPLRIADVLDDESLEDVLRAALNHIRITHPKEGL